MPMPSPDWIGLHYVEDTDPKSEYDEYDEFEEYEYKCECHDGEHKYDRLCNCNYCDHIREERSDRAREARKMRRCR